MALVVPLLATKPNCDSDISGLILFRILVWVRHHQSLLYEIDSMINLSSRLGQVCLWFGLDSVRPWKSIYSCSCSWTSLSKNLGDKRRLNFDEFQQSLASLIQDRLQSAPSIYNQKPTFLGQVRQNTTYELNGYCAIWFRQHFTHISPSLRLSRTWRQVEIAKTVFCGIMLLRSC